MLEPLGAALGPKGSRTPARRGQWPRRDPETKLLLTKANGGLQADRSKVKFMAQVAPGRSLHKGME